jgi:hypothetical protein
MKLPNSIYDKLKWICLIVLPALSVLYGALAHIWGLPYASEIPLTIEAIDVFLGALIGISNYNIKKEDKE